MKAFYAHALPSESSPRTLREVGTSRVEGRTVILAVDAAGVVFVLNRNSSIDMCAAYGGNSNLRRLYCRLAKIDPKDLARARAARLLADKKAEAEREVRALKLRAAKLGFAIRKLPKS